MLANWRPSVQRRMDALGLTAAEQQIVWLVFTGAANAEIAYDLGIKEETVKRHLTVIYRKVDVPNRVTLVLALLDVIG